MLFRFLVLGALCFHGCNAQCKDVNNANVDWFVILKLPKNAVTNPTGYHFMYADKNSPNLVISASTLDVAANNPLALTLEPPTAIFGTNPNYLVYSEAPPGTTHSHRGHTKGILFWDQFTVTWILHSIPRFPEGPVIPGSGYTYDYPANAEDFGQSILCYSGPTTGPTTGPPGALPMIAEQLFYSWPNIYAHGAIQPGYLTTIPNLNNLITYPRRHFSGAPSYITQILPSPGTFFRAYSNMQGAGTDIWTVIANDLQSPLLTETWQRGAGGVTPSFCTLPNTVENIVALNFPGFAQYSNMVDHSKWGIDKNGGLAMVCIGDLNRMDSQQQRGGNVVCLRSTTLWNDFRTAVAQIEDCPPGPG